MMEPDFPMALGRLQALSKDDLHELFTNESKFDDYIKSLDQVNYFISITFCRICLRFNGTSCRCYRMFDLSLSFINLVSNESSSSIIII
jgi:hypothetical protein